MGIADGDATPIVTVVTTPRRVLVFGGTFDPPHTAHAHLPALVAQQRGCERIIYVPAAINPLKTSTQPAPADHRLAMLLMTVADVPEAHISAIELERPGPSYTIDTLRMLKENTARDRGIESSGKGVEPLEFHLLIGCDQALEFHKWKDWRDILTLATPAVMIRPPWDRDSFEKQLRATYDADEADRWIGWIVNVPRMDVSSTDIRRRLANGESLDGMIDPAVARYIELNGLYR